MPNMSTSFLLHPSCRTCRTRPQGRVWRVRHLPHPTFMPNTLNTPLGACSTCLACSSPHPSTSSPHYPSCRTLKICPCGHVFGVQWLPSSPLLSQHPKCDVWSHFGCWLATSPLLPPQHIEHQKHAHVGVFLVLDGFPSLPFYPTPETRQQMSRFGCLLAPPHWLPSPSTSTRKTRCCVAFFMLAGYSSPNLTSLLTFLLPFSPPSHSLLITHFI